MLYEVITHGIPAPIGDQIVRHEPPHATETHPEIVGGLGGENLPHRFHDRADHTRHGGWHLERQGVAEGKHVRHNERGHDPVLPFCVRPRLSPGKSYNFV